MPSWWRAIPYRSFLLALSLAGLLCLSTRVPSSAQGATWQSAWPMVGHDAQRTNRSAATVAPHLTLQSSHAGVYDRPVVAQDGTMYVWSAGGLTALGPSGDTRWTYRAWSSEGGPPVLAPDGTVYVSGLTSSEIALPNVALFGLSRDGRLVEHLRTSAFSKGAPPAETADGTLYVPYVGPTEENAGLIVMPAGGAARRLQPGFTFQAMAVGPNGTIYALGRYSSHEGGLSLERLTPAGKVRWRHAIALDGSSVMIGVHGWIFVASGSAVGGYSPPNTQISAYTPGGRLLWRHTPKLGLAVLGLRSDGSILAAGQQGLIAYAPDGTRLWRVPLGGSTLDAVPSLVLDAQDTDLVGSGDGRIRVFSRSGTLVDTLQGGTPSTVASPQLSLGADGRLVVVGADDVLRVYG